MIDSMFSLKGRVALVTGGSKGLGKSMARGFSAAGADVFVSGFLIRAGVMATTIGLSWACAAIVPDGLRRAIQHQPFWMQFIQLFLLSDAGFYLAHRLVHAVPWLWRFHAVHHSSEQMDWLSTFRVHPVDQILNTTIIAVPAVALNFSPAVLLTFGLL